MAIMSKILDILLRKFQNREVVKMIENAQRITIFAGNLGSGKTELAINYALQLQSAGKTVNIVDLDIINPYFRTRLIRDQLTGLGLKVICPAGGLAGADVPALSPAIRGVLEDTGSHGVFDVGGDDVGAVALGRFKELLPPGSHHLFFVVNACRPFTRDVAGIHKMLRAVEQASRLRATALVSNTNLGRETTPEVILAGHATVARAAREAGLTVALAAARRDLAPAVQESLGPGTPVLPLDLRMRPPWEEATTDPLLRIPQR